MIAVLAVASSSSCLPGSGKQVLRVANWGGAGDDTDFARTIREALKDFEEQNPDVEIQIEGIPGAGEYVRKMLLSFVAGTEPDVMTLDGSSAAVFIENGVLMDLTPLMDSDPAFSPDAYWPNVMNLARRGEKLYSVPLDFTPMVMYCNARLFREAGVPLPTDGWTFEEFRETARRLTKNGRYGFSFSNWMPGWIMWLWNNGGDVFPPEGGRSSGVLDSDQNAAAVAMIRDLVEKDKSAPSLSAAAALGVDPFANGDAAMTISGHWSLVGFGAAKNLKLEDLHVVSLPTNIGASKTVIYQAGLAIGKNTKNRDLAWRFVKHMTSRAVQRKINRTGIAISARKDVSIENSKGPLKEAFLRIIPSGRPPWGARIEGYDFVESEGKKMMEAVLQGGVEPKSALAEMARRVDRQLEQK